MSTPVRISAFVVALAAVFALALGLGRVVGPVVAPEPATHEGMTGNMTGESSGDTHLPGGLMVSQDGYTLRLADLTPDKYKYYVSAYDVDVSIDIRNDGLAATRATTLSVTLQIWDPSRSTQYGQDIEVIARSGSIWLALTKPEIEVHAGDRMGGRSGGQNYLHPFVSRWDR